MASDESADGTEHLECVDCGTTENVQRTPHSLAEAGLEGNPPLCPDCDRRRSR